MSISEAIQEAVRTLDAEAANNITAVLRWKYGYKYKDIVDAFVRNGCRDAGEYEDLINS